MAKLYYLLVAIMVGSLSACSGKTEYNYPKSDEEMRKERVGSFVSDDPSGGFVIFGQGKGKNGKSNNAFADSYIWRATLDVLSFMPLQSSDSVGGVIITDWYEDPKAPHERFKINVVITNPELKVDAVKVTAFKQVLGQHNQWRDAPVSNKLASELEDKIILRARQLKVGEIG